MTVALPILYVVYGVCTALVVWGCVVDVRER